MYFNKTLAKTTLSSIDNKKKAIELFPSGEEESSVQFGEKWSMSIINGNLTIVYAWQDITGDENTFILHENGQQFEWQFRYPPMKSKIARETIDYEHIKKNW